MKNLSVKLLRLENEFIWWYENSGWKFALGFLLGGLFVFVLIKVIFL